ncbi:MAG TPA: STAS domain-containing protein [Acidimicrobiales bacterium]|nr:STAS domain-containing protein [Acidimicrobiales bacterium]
MSAEGAATVIALQGEADVSTLAALADTFARICADGEGDVVVDLSRIEFMDTATLRVVLVAKAALAGDGRRLTLRSPSRIAARVLGVFGLDHLVSPPAAGRR